MIGFDETVMQPASRRRRRRFVTAVVDVGTGQILDVFEGRDAKHLRAWMARIPLSWLAFVRVVPWIPTRATAARWSTRTRPPGRRARSLT
jgi:transposase